MLLPNSEHARYPLALGPVGRCPTQAMQAWLWMQEWEWSEAEPAETA